MKAGIGQTGALASSPWPWRAASRSRLAERMRN